MTSSYLFLNRASVDLDFDNVCLLHRKRRLGRLRVADGPHDGAVVHDAAYVRLHLGAVNPLGVLGESLLLRLVPVLVKSAPALVRQVASPHSAEHPKTTRSLNVTNKPNDDHGRGLHNGNRLDRVLLVKLGPGLVGLVSHVGHTGLVAHERRKVRRLAGVVLRE
ncbi:microtubule-associated serine/threonine-protein kinase 2-like [Babesia caballi]|uniref:Microtubule-associated serine/threonine-protein kinase 2-like n=1 Tax=Babesia caballi TaxID=5871 RepID=A0AAV4LVL8_BABCB|nr:microtubule-associated serine/threonine-protein kinase 2-like [Babesia caballi]